MLKLLTHKLRTHSINEDNYVEQADENHDSGTESDDEVDDPELTNSGIMERMCSVSPADTGCSMESPTPNEHDPHSSEEELEVINMNPAKEIRAERLLRATSVCLPEKRKWSQVGDSSSRYYSPENEENMSHYGNMSPTSPCFMVRGVHGDDTVHIEHSGSSDEEVHNLLASMATPVQFRTSPPLEAIKLGRKTPINKIRTMSPPSKVLHYEDSPRKRSRHMRHSHIQRPYLDFEKMQQLKTRPVTAWRHPGDHGGELSVYCW